MHISYFYNISLPTTKAASIRILNTLRPLCDNGFSVDLYIRNLSDTPEQCMAYYDLTRHEHFTIVPFYNRRRFPWQFRRQLEKMLQQRPKDTPHFVMSRAETALRTFGLLRPKDLEGRQRIIYEAHRLCAEHAKERGASNREVRRVADRERAVVGQADGMITNTTGVANHLRNAYAPTCPIVVVPNGTQKSIAAQLMDAERDIDILYVGKLLKRKGVDVLIESMKWLPAQRLTLVGGTPNEIAHYKRLAGEWQVGDRIAFVGAIPPSKLADYYARAKVGVCPLPTGESIISDVYTNPIKLGEMMAHGVPIVCSRTSTTEAVVNDETALLIEPSNAKALAEGVIALLNDRSKAFRLAARAREVAKEMTWEARAQQMGAFLESLV